MKAYLHLIKFFLAKDCTISVWDGEEWAVSKSSSYNAIKGVIEGVEEAEIRVRNSAGEKILWASIIPSLNPEESVSNWSDNEYGKAWVEAYENKA
jgi:hypothetical protein